MIFFVGVAIVARAVLIPAFPNLSDDIYRFIWDGHLVHLGYNPYIWTPSQLIEQTGLARKEWFEFLYDKLNSQDYYTVYPAIGQIIFWLMTIIPESLNASHVIMKLIFLAADIGTIYLLLKLLPALRIATKHLLLYALNPLIVVELFGNLHLELVAIFFLALSFWFLITKKKWFLGAAFAGAVATKLVPLLLMPVFIFRYPFRKTWPGILAGLLFLICTFGIFYDQSFSNIFKSVNLYFQNFEFNASIYYLVRYVGYQYKGYNMIASIGPLLSVATFLIIIVLAFFQARKGSIKAFFRACLLAFTVYLMLSTTIHPWYVGTLVFLCVFTRYRFPIFWSAAVMLSYVHYRGAVHNEHYLLICIEYVIVYTVFLVELFKWPVMQELGKMLRSMTRSKE